MAERVTGIDETLSTMRDSSRTSLKIVDHLINPLIVLVCGEQ